MEKLLLLFLFSAFVFPSSGQEKAARFAAQEPARTAVYPSYTSEGVRVYERGIRLSVPSVRNLFYGTPAYDVYAKGVRYNRIGHGLLWPGVWFSAWGTVIIGIGSRPNNEPEGMGFIVVGMGIATLITGLPLIGTGIALRVKGKRMVARAVGMYNDYLDTSGSNYFPEISLGATPGGLGMVYTF